MKIITTVAEMYVFSRNLHGAGKTIGLVPTMGCLHEGHLSLIKESKRITDITVVSIFVNPIQFGPKEDYDRYPSDIEADIKRCSGIGADILFLPSAYDIYPKGYKTYVIVEDLSDRLCGIFRPSHFKGVATVVTKLFNIIRPDKAFFGQKDYQQALIIKQLVRDLNLGADIIVMPTVREADGLAMSSRNSYLDPAEREAAGIIYRSLALAEDLVRSGEISAKEVKARMEAFINSGGSVRIEYISICSPETLEEIEMIEGGILIAIAAWIGSTRLIDNIIIRKGKESQNPPFSPFSKGG